MAAPPYLQPFVLPVAEARRQREGNLDVYWPDASKAELTPVVIFVHGGPVPADLRPSPRDWPVYVGHGSLAASHGVVGVTFDHRLHSVAGYPAAAADVGSAVEPARALPGVDPDRGALWFFSGAGPLTADWLSGPPAWLRCLAATYTVERTLIDITRSGDRALLHDAARESLERGLTTRKRLAHAISRREDRTRIRRDLGLRLPAVRESA